VLGMSVCKWCEKPLKVTELLFCSKACFYAWQGQDKHKAPMCRLSYGNKNPVLTGEHKIIQIPIEDKLNELESMYGLGKRTCHFTVKFNEKVSKKTLNNLKQLINQYKALRLSLNKSLVKV